MQYFDLDIVMAIGTLCVIIVGFVWYSHKKRVVSNKRQEEVSPTIGETFYSANSSNSSGDEGIVAIRKKTQSDENPENVNTESKKGEKDTPKKVKSIEESKNDVSVAADVPRILILHVMSKENAAFSGYELLQILLSTGLRFGKGNIFHYFREPNEQTDILFSLASATEPGVFDIQNMGSCTCLGLTLFMQVTKNEYDDNARYDLMLQTAHHLAEDLGGIVLDAKRNALSQFKISPNSLPDELALEQ